VAQFEWMLGVKETIGLRGVGIPLIVVAPQQAERDQSVEEISCSPLMQPEPEAKRSQIEWGPAKAPKTPISTALKRVLDAQKPIASCMMRSCVTLFVIGFCSPVYAALTAITFVWQSFLPRSARESCTFSALILHKTLSAATRRRQSPPEGTPG
jgi:hypothetical protein